MKVCWRATAFAGLCASCSPTPASRAHFRDALFLDIGYAWMHQLFVGLMLAGEQTPERPFVTVGRIRQEAAGHTDCCSRVARLQGFLPLRETGAGWYPLGSAEGCQGARPRVSRIRKTSTRAAARS
jgi:hypothetical protein